MFSGSEKYYDEIYAALGKDYRKETQMIHRLIGRHKRSRGNRLLDVACGTGKHAGLLARHYQVEGLDLDARMLSIARRNNPGMRFHRGDLADFRLSRQFDVIVCLFSSIGYVRTKSRLGRALKTMERHMAPGGVLLVEPWLGPTEWRPGRTAMVIVDKPDLKIVRMHRSGRRGRISILEFQYLFGTPEGLAHASERHEVGLFTRQEYLQAFRSAGLEVFHYPQGPIGRGLYVGRKASV